MRKTPRERFQKVSIDRAEKIIQDIKMWGNTANHYTYEFEREEIQLIITTIQEELEKISTRFSNELDKKEGHETRKSMRTEEHFKELRENNNE